MKRPRNIATLADILVLALLVFLNPFRPSRFTSDAMLRHNHPRLSDKVEIVYRQPVDPDTIAQHLRFVEDEISEMKYYLRIHNVTDDGYNLVAHYKSRLQQEYQQLLNQPQGDSLRTVVTTRRIAAKDRPMIAVRTKGGYWKAGHFYVRTPLQGKGLVRDYQGRVVSAVWDADTIVSATRIDSRGIYQGQMDRHYLPCGQGIMDEWDGCHKEGFWRDDMQHGFGFDSSPLLQLRIGTWKNGKFLGEKLKYTAERIYGIDISRHQHEKGRHRYGINWRSLRITSLGKRHQTEGRTFPVSFVYIKATEGTTVRNRYFASDYRSARRNRIAVGAYHFFSLQSSAADQARYFLRHAFIRLGDFPPVLDVEPSESQIRKIGGDEELMRRIRTFLQIVEKKTGMRPILYISQSFINKHMTNATDIKQRYNVWIARYNEYKPDVKLVYWQLCPDGRVEGITGPVDINVFNGYQGQYDDFIRTGFHQ